MTRDLEETLNELGPGYREVVARLEGAYMPIDISALRAGVGKPYLKVHGGAGRTVGWSFSYLIAASLLVFLGLGIFVSTSPRAVRNEYVLAGMRDAASVEEIIRTQNPDGSWKNDFLTRQNSAALRLCSDPEARIAYKKAMRNLRTRGLL